MENDISEESLKELRPEAGNKNNQEFTAVFGRFSKGKMGYIPVKITSKIRSINLEHKLFLIIFSTIAVLLLFCLSVIAYSDAANDRRDKETALYNYFIQSQEQLERYFNQIDFLAYTVMFSSWVQQLIENSSAARPDLLLYQVNVNRFLKSLAIMNNDVSMVLLTDHEMVYSENPLYSDPRYDITAEPWFSELLQNKKHIEYGTGGRSLFGEFAENWSMTLFYVVINIRTFNRIGYFVINIPLEKFDFLLNDVQYDTIEINDTNGNLIYGGSSGNYTGSNGYNRIFYENSLLDGNWNVRLFRYLKGFSIAEIKNYYLFLLLLIPILGIFSIITFSFSRYLTNPIVRCRNAMMEIQNNNFGIILENHYKDEIGGLITGFNEMSSTLVTLRQKNTKMEKLRRETEMDMLQQKVNPHFLFNTLEIINALIIDGQYEEAVQVCELLGQIYHYNMMINKWVKLRDEIEYVKKYLKMLQLKMNSLSVVWEISEESMNADCLKFMLQPLVENAVRHGFSSKQSDACLTISLKSLPDDKIEIIIMDNGSGIQTETRSKIEETLENIRQEVSLSSAHIGISNVYQRLYLEYGSTFGFQIESRQDFGTKITITIPADVAGK